MFDKLKQWWNIQKFHRSDVGVTLKNLNQTFWYGNTILASHSEEFKRDAIESMYQSVIEVYFAENPFLKLRENICNYVGAETSFSAMALKKEEKPYLRDMDSPYLSGELYKHIEELVAENDEFQRAAWKIGDMSHEDRIDFANGRACFYKYHTNCMNALRVDFKDIDLKTDKDWLMPFAKAQSIFWENVYRNKLNLPPLGEDFVDQIKFGAFMEYVHGGAHDPYFEWVKAFPEMEEKLLECSAEETWKELKAG